MKILIAGSTGQVASALVERAAAHNVTVVACGRPELDLAVAETLARAITAHAPDMVINAAAWTAVDAAETQEDAAFAINATGAGALATACGQAGIPIFHLSTDYVFDGTKPAPYVETDPTGPTGAYGRSKLAGEIAVAAANPAHAIFRTAWVHAPYGGNFVRTMLRVAATRDEVGVVGDQHGNPSYAPDIADALLRAAQRYSGTPAQNGVFHLAGAGEASWADVAKAVFAESAARGGVSASVRRIATADYPTPARRPANSRLDCGSLQAIYGIALPAWQDGVARCVARLLKDAA